MKPTNLQPLMLPLLLLLCLADTGFSAGPGSRGTFPPRPHPSTDDCLPSACDSPYVCCKPQAQLDKCEFGLAKDVCGCCNVCAKGRGEVCGSPRIGTCAEGLVCIHSTSGSGEPGKCDGPSGERPGFKPCAHGGCRDPPTTPTPGPGARPGFKPCAHGGCRDTSTNPSSTDHSVQWRSFPGMVWTNCKTISGKAVALAECQSLCLETAECTSVQHATTENGDWCELKTWSESCRKPYVPAPETDLPGTNGYLQVKYFAGISAGRF